MRVKLRVAFPVWLPLKLHRIFVQIDLTTFAEKDGGDQVRVEIRDICCVKTHLLLRAIRFLDHRVGDSITFYDCSAVTREQNLVTGLDGLETVRIISNVYVGRVIDYPASL